MLGILPGEHLRPPFQTVSNGSPTLESAPWKNFRLCEVALLGHHPRSARHGSTEREFFQLGVHVSDKGFRVLPSRVEFAPVAVREVRAHFADSSPQLLVLVGAPHVTPPAAGFARRAPDPGSRRDR